ncbi:MAG: RluA family pseudouridine synthase [Candidatus Sungbacteria bacterium]|nr:RluA family pseudouridine synthase [Candidatus Sungbacteria bacterium]
MTLVFAQHSCKNAYMKDIDVIYSDADMIIMNKPAGLLVHPVKSLAISKPQKKREGKAGSSLSPSSIEATSLTSNGVNGGGSVTGETLTDFLLKKFPEIKHVGDEPELRPGIVHRLDRDTSGIMVVARTQKAFEGLKDIFKTRKAEKKYRTLVCGAVPGKTGSINSPIGRLIKNPTKRGTTHIRGARDAETHYTVLRRFGKEYTLLEVLPKTGRMHQIRVHLASIHHPIACDTKYGGKKVCCPNELKRFFLHAYSLEFSYPKGKRWHFEADLPNDLASVLNNLDKNDYI